MTRVALLLTGFAFAAESTANAQTSSFGELQAAYIFNFAKYVRWPVQPERFVIGVYGGVGIIEHLEKAFGGKRIGGKPTALKVIETPEDMMECNIIYVPESGSKHIRELTAATKGKNILIVTEEDLIRRGAPISFVVVDERLRFKLKQSALREAGLTASEGLLKLAILQ